MNTKMKNYSNDNLKGVQRTHTTVQNEKICKNVYNESKTTV